MKVPTISYFSALKLFFILGMLSLSVCPSHASYTQDQYTELDRLASNFFNLLKSEKYKETAELFHYPESYKLDKLAEDKMGIYKTLELIQREFGSVSSRYLFEDDIELYNFSLQGGNTEYWNNHPDFIQKRYKVVFLNSQEGFITFKFCKFENKFEIRSIVYSKQASEEGKKFMMSLMEKVSKEIIPLFQPKQKAP